LKKRLQQHREELLQLLLFIGKRSKKRVGSASVFQNLTPNWEGVALQVVDLLVDLIGIEPMTSSMPWKRAPSCATGPLSGRTSSILADRNAFVNVNRELIVSFGV
jgi:hypothetical protein